MKQIAKLMLCVVLTVLVGCEDKDNPDYTLATNAVTLNTKDSLVLDIKPTTKGLTFESANPLIAECIDGKIYGNLAGETQILIASEDAKFSKICNVTVNPRFTLYKEPYLSFGSNSAIIKSKESRLLVQDTSYFENSVINQILYFRGENNDLLQATYLFQNSQLEYVYLLLKESSAERAIAHMDERFLYIYAEEEYLYYLHPVPPSLTDQNKAVLITYSAFVDDSDPNDVATYVAIDYFIVELEGASNSPVALKKAGKEYIAKHRQELHKRRISRLNR